MFEKMKGFVSGVKEKANAKMLAAPALAAGVAAVSSVTAFAAEGDTTAGNLPNLAITTDMLSPLVEGVTANIAVILPVGIGIFAIFLGIRILPKLISKFTKV